MQSLVVFFLALAGTSIAAPTQDRYDSQAVPVISAQIYHQAAPGEFSKFDRLARNAVESSVQDPVQDESDGEFVPVIPGPIRGGAGHGALPGLNLARSATDNNAQASAHDQSDSQFVPVISATVNGGAAPGALPGFNHLARNATKDDGPQAPASAAFDGTCEQITLGGHGKVGMTTLDGLCRNSAGEWWKTSLNLNECIGNVGGNLVYQAGGGFDATCRPCTIDNVHGGDNMNLKCNCLDEKRMPRFTALEIGSRVGSPLAVKLVDGRFVCGSNSGSMGPAFAQ
ncbi:hypothetical protein V8C35DRAFT_303490 [Trichoderma chlorosporum]